LLVGIEVKKMSDLLKSGATMLQETCPVCGTPLFRKGKETFCPKCNQPVAIVKTTEDETRLMTDRVLENSEHTLLTKIQETSSALKGETDPERLASYGAALTSWLDAIEKLRRLRERTE
jgi:UPF0148 protein